MKNNRDFWYHDKVKNVDDYCPPEEMNSEDLLFILYTSGSTGKPKGVVHSCAGYMLYTHFTFENVEIENCYSVVKSFSLNSGGICGYNVAYNGMCGIKPRVDKIIYTIQTYKNQEVEYEVEENDKGLVAVNVTPK